MSKTLVLELGRQPKANGFLKGEDFKKEIFFDANVVIDDKTKLLSLAKTLDKNILFNDEYVYHSSGSQTMRCHFQNIAHKIKNQFKPKNILEIGSNDGVFIKHFKKKQSLCVEPCGNFANMTAGMGYKTYEGFWDWEMAETVKKMNGLQDVVYAANCMCHIPEITKAFEAVHDVLTTDGVFIFEDPSLAEMFNRTSYDQIYDEHAHIFSVTSLAEELMKANMIIFHVENLPVHGGSNRIYAARIDSEYKVSESVMKNLDYERSLGLQNIKAYNQFASNVEQSRERLVNLLTSIKNNGKKIISYGATSKSTTVFNYCNIGTNYIDYITDITPDKQGKFSPGMHIPVISPEAGMNIGVDFAYLGAWNFANEIMEKESAFIERGGKFITHVPFAGILNPY